jgi:chromosome segregation ATPase
MKLMACVVVVALSSVGLPAAHASVATPVNKVLQLLSDLHAKITAEGVEAKKVYEEFNAWCKDRSANIGFEIRTAKSEVMDLKATIEKETATASSLNAKIEELAASLATDEADLKAATEIRVKETADYSAEEKELREAISALERAIPILEREMKKGSASMMQVQNTDSIAQVLNVMVEASELGSADAAKLAALVQNSQGDDDSDIGAPAGAVYTSQSGSIVETLENLLDKAQTQLDDIRRRETSARHNFDLLKQSIEDEIKFAKKDMAAAKKGLSESAELKSSAEGDLAVTSKDLAGDISTKSTLKHDCTSGAEDFEASTKSRAEELKAIADAKKVISESTSGADAITYGLNQVSFLQIRTDTDLINFEAVQYVRDLARKVQSPALSQLASRMASAMRFSGGAGLDPFSKVRGLISDMISRLEAEASAEASHKAYCDTQLADTNGKKADKSAEIEKLSAKIDTMTSRSAQLKEEVAALFKTLAQLHATQAEMDSMRQTQRTAFASNKAEMEQGLEGIKMGMKLLREYYAKDDAAHDAAEGTANSIIGLLEVVESDFSSGLAEMTATEENEQASYEEQTKANEIEKVLKEQDLKYKKKESTSLDKTATEASSDRSGVQAELDAVLEYLSKLRDQCIAKAETYSERSRRRKSEIDGLKEALKILEGEGVFLQSKSRTQLRGTQ